MIIQTDQSQQYRFFYLDRKLSATNPLQILQALQSAESFIADVTKIQLLNSVMIRLMGILKNCDKLFIKQKICFIISFYIMKIKTIPNIEIITKYFTKGVRTENTLTRIIILKTLSEIITTTTLLHKQSSLYHNLLAKIQKNQSKDFEIRNQRKFAYKCLKNLLKHSSYIANCFAKNLEAIYQYGNVSSCTLLSLCLFGDFKPQEYELILTKAKIIVQQRNIPKNKSILEQIVVKFLSINYHLFSQYSSKYISLLGDEMKQWVKLFLVNKYPFVKSMKQTQDLNQSFEQYIDHLYILKKQGSISLINKSSLQKIINNQKQSKNIHNLALTLYYSENKQDQKILLSLIEQKINQMTNFDQKYWLRLLKICLVSAAYASSNMIVDLLLENIAEVSLIDRLMWIRMFLTLCNFIANKSILQISDFLPLFQNFTNFLFPNSNFNVLIKQWSDIYIQKQQKQIQIKPLQTGRLIQCEEINCMKKISKYLKCEKQNEFTRVWFDDISKTIPGFKISQLKNKELSVFGFLTKKSVLKILKIDSL